MSKQSELWSQIVASTAQDSLLYFAMHHTARVLSKMVNRPLKIKDITLKTRPISQIMVYDDNPEAETVGIYLRINNDLPGQAMLILSLTDAMCLADWLLELRPGTTTFLDDMKRSALAEFGNVTLSSFLNAIADLTGTVVMPFPPAVRVDMLATLIQAAITITSLGKIVDELLIVETEFVNVQSELLFHFWLLPKPASYYTKE